MNCEVTVRASAEKELEKLPAKIKQQITEKILELENNPRTFQTKKLKDRDEYRLRVGNYRIIYTINDRKKLVEVFAVVHRQEGY